jgi:hypothetical protein
LGLVPQIRIIRTKDNVPLLAARVGEAVSDRASAIDHLIVGLSARSVCPSQLASVFSKVAAAARLDPFFLWQLQISCVSGWPRLSLSNDAHHAASQIDLQAVNTGPRILISAQRPRQALCVSIAPPSLGSLLWQRRERTQ